MGYYYNVILGYARTETPNVKEIRSKIEKVQSISKAHQATVYKKCGGYVQSAGGYILNAKCVGIKEFSQYWYLIY